MFCKLKRLTFTTHRYFIEPEATEDNTIPVVNIHLSEPLEILPSSPLAGKGLFL